MTAAPTAVDAIGDPAASTETRMRVLRKLAMCPSDVDTGRRQAVLPSCIVRVASLEACAEAPIKARTDAYIDMAVNIANRMLRMMPGVLDVAPNAASVEVEL